MVVDQLVLDACLKGVLIERGMLADEADHEIAKHHKRDPRQWDSGMTQTVREVASILLTLHAHGLIFNPANAARPWTDL